MAAVLALPPVLKFLDADLSGYLFRSSFHSSSASCYREPDIRENQIEVTVNGKVVHVPRGSMALEATSRAHVHVPTLCRHPRLPATQGTCRVCMVDLNGTLKPACCTPVTEGANINTDTPEVLSSIKGTLALLRANHPEGCMTCDVAEHCEFRSMIARYKVPQLPKLREVSEDYKQYCESWDPVDTSNPAIHLDREKCIQCGRCVQMCQDVQKMNVLGFMNRGRYRHLAFLQDTTMALSKCISCGQCVSVCPVGALTERTTWREVLEELQEGRKIMVAQTAPATRVAIGEELGLEPGTISTGQMVAALKRLGFHYVFDTDFSADLTIMEEGTELIGRLQKAWSGKSEKEGGPALPMFTSCCPAWVACVEKEYPHLIPHLSSCKSPQQMLGAVVKEFWAKKVAKVKPEDICFVSIMPCTAKKEEAERPTMGRDGYRDVDHVLTTRELGHLLRFQSIPMYSLPPEPYDNPMGDSSGAAVLFGATGGVMEAALRTVYEVLVGAPLPRLELSEVRGLNGVKEAVVNLALKDGTSRDVRVAVASGIANARSLLKDIQAGKAQYDFVEVMSCPGGCIGGGGQPKAKDPSVLLRRMQSIYSIDERAVIRKSHENPGISALYRDFLKAGPGGEESHHLLHTQYTNRSLDGGLKECKGTTQ